MFGGCGMIVLLVYWETTWIFQIWLLRSCTKEPKGTWRNFSGWLGGFGTIETKCFIRQMEPQKRQAIEANDVRGVVSHFVKGIVQSLCNFLE